jgi:EmrB/QacA subfamily drug resistance transporter
MQSATANPRRWTALMVLSLVQLVLVLDDGVVNVALPALRVDLDLPSTSLAWVSNSYALVFGALLLAGGWLGDRYGRRAVFLTGSAIFGLASIGCAAAQSTPFFLSARVLEGVGAALASPTALALVVANFPEDEERNKALGMWGIAAGVGGILGMTASGLIVGLANWHWAFLINVPLVLVVLATVPKLTPESRGQGDGRADWWGVVTVTAGLALLIHGLLVAAADGEIRSHVVEFAVAAGFLITFVVLQVRQERPMIPHGFFAARNRATGFVVSFLMAGSFMAVFFALSLHLQNTMHWSALRTGLALTVQPVVSFFIFPVAAGLTFKLGVRSVLPVGLGICAAGMFWLGRISGPTDYLTDILPSLVLLGIGTALAFVAASAAGFGGSDEAAGLASGVIDAAQQIGTAVGLAALVSIAAWGTASVPGGNPLGGHVGRAFLAAGVVLALAALGSALVMEAAAFGPPDGFDEGQSGHDGPAGTDRPEPGPGPTGEHAQEVRHE